MERILSLKLLSTEGSQLFPLPTAMEAIILPGIKRHKVLSKKATGRHWGNRDKAIFQLLGLFIVRESGKKDKLCSIQYHLHTGTRRYFLVCSQLHHALAKCRKDQGIGVFRYFSAGS